MDDVRTAISECRDENEFDPSPLLDEALALIPSLHAPLECADFEEIITEFLDGFVPAPVYHQFEEHAGLCSSCSATLTDVVYAVAACHSVHTYEDYPTPEPLVARLEGIMPQPIRRRKTKLAQRISTVAALLIPRRTEGSAWSFVTASLLAFVSFGLLMINFSDDLSVRGIYRKARVTAAQIYSDGSDIYAEKDNVVGRFQEVRSDLGEIWKTLGGADDEKMAAANGNALRATVDSPTENARKSDRK